MKKDKWYLYNLVDHTCVATLFKGVWKKKQTKYKRMIIVLFDIKAMSF